jgi:glycosyltransferase involved in cell wall biosynthesis
MFGWEYPPKHAGGLGIACQGLVRGLLHHGVQVTLVLPQEGAQEPGLSILSPCGGLQAALRVRSGLQPYDSFQTFADRSRGSTAAVRESLYGQDLGGAVLAFEEESLALTQHLSPTIVHSHDWMTFGAGWRAANHHRVPFIAQVHATELDRTHFRPNEWIYGKERWGLTVADHIITVSSYTRDLLIREYGISGDKISVVHNSTQEIPQGPPQTTVRVQHPLVLFLGRLTVQKGPFHFLEAARLVHERNADARFVIAGDGYLLGELVNRACASGLQDVVIFAGNVRAEEVQELFRRASCFVMPSTSEPFGLVALEAVAHGVPVILSKQSGVREVIPHAFHVDFWDIEKFADCILTVLREEPLALQLRSEAPAILRHLTWENQAAKVLSIYNNVRLHS